MIKTVLPLTSFKTYFVCASRFQSLLAPALSFNMVGLRLHLWDLPKIAWAIFVWLELKEIVQMRLVSQRLRDLATADMLWLTIAKTVLLVRQIMPRDTPTEVMRYLANRTLCDEPLYGTYSYVAAPGTENILVREAELTISHGRLGFTRAIARIRLKVTFAVNDIEDVCLGTMRYSFTDRRFHVVTRRKSLKGWVSGPQFYVLAAPHRKPWMGETKEHFEEVCPSALRLILTIDRPGSWGAAFGCEVNGLIAVMRHAPELALDDGGGTQSAMQSPQRHSSSQFLDRDALSPRKR